MADETQDQAVAETAPELPGTPAVEAAQEPGDNGAVTAAENEAPKTYADLGAWRKARADKWILPSGLTVITRRGVTVLDLIGEGEIPESLVQFFDMAFKSGGQLEIDRDSINPELMPAVLSAFNAMARAALIEPAITDTPTDTTITADELTYDDKAAIFERANEGVRRVSKFRPGSG